MRVAPFITFQNPSSAQRTTGRASSGDPSACHHGAPRGRRTPRRRSISAAPRIVSARTSIAAPDARETAAVAVSPRVTQNAHSASVDVRRPASGGATSSRRNAGSQATASARRTMSGAASARIASARSAPATFQIVRHGYSDGRDGPVQIPAGSHSVAAASTAA